MGLTTAMYTGLTGLNVNQTRIETIGHNIANVNTNAFKGSRTLFQTQFARTLSPGTPPSANSGGTNPMQIGLGAMVGSTQRMISAGGLETTGLSGDLAVEGDGYFIVRDARGGEFYTRDGAFSLNSQNQLVNANGYRLRGYGVDQAFQIVPGQLQDLQIPLGMQTIARATQNIGLDGDLSAAEVPATAGALLNSQALVAAGGGAATDALAITDLRSAADATTPLFAAGDVITVSGATRGERELPDAQFIVGTTGTTLADFASWLQDTLGIQTGAGVPGNPGVFIENGQLVVRSNTGLPNAIGIDPSNIRSSSATVPLPFQFTETAPAVGGGVFTSFTVYDSLGNPVPVQATFTLDSLPNTGPVWRYYLESTVPGQLPQLLGTGTVAFDQNGTFNSASGNQFNLSRAGTGAVTPQTITLDFSALNGLSTQLSDVVMAGQDGFPPGTLTGFAVGVDGTISGAFSNGLSRALGQVVLGTFSNEAGLIAEADNLFAVGPNSGPVVVKPPGALGAGQVRGGALEMSNVDISREFIGLITSNTAFQASSRVISTAADMLDQLMVALR